MVAEKSAADDGVGGQGLRFARDLQALYAAAGGRSAFGYQRLIRIGEQDGFEVSTSSLSEWFRGTSVPREPSKVRYVLNVLVPFLEDQAALRSPDHQRTAAGTWSARLAAAQAVSKSGQGGRGPRVGAASAGRLLGMPSQALQDALPHEFVGRGAELDASAAFAAAPDGGPSYLWWQADAWAGKSALLAWFATRRLPAGIDAVQHFIARRLGTNRREHFALAVAEQLASLAGRKLRAPERDRPEHHLPALYEEAARAGRNRHRRLLLIVDGLDEDAEAGPGGLSIAALLPKEPPHGMRIIVSGRAHPQVPEDVADEHPLRDPGTVRRLAASPAAHVIRDTALRELHALLEDERIGCRLLGLLVAAQGALTGADLAALAGVRPREVRKRLRSVVGRSMAPTDTDRLELGVRATADADAEAGRQTFVLAHEELFRAAAADLGEAELATYREHLHAWADGYRDGGGRRTPRTTCSPATHGSCRTPGTPIGSRSSSSTRAASSAWSSAPDRTSPSPTSPWWLRPLPTERRRVWPTRPGRPPPVRPCSRTPAPCRAPSYGRWPGAATSGGPGHWRACPWRPRPRRFTSPTWPAYWRRRPGTRTPGPPRRRRGRGRVRLFGRPDPSATRATRRRRPPARPRSPCWRRAGWRRGLSCSARPADRARPGTRHGRR